jgi:hypothetical protein
MPAAAPTPPASQYVGLRYSAQLARWTAVIAAEDGTLLPVGSFLDEDEVCRKRWVLACIRSETLTRTCAQAARAYDVAARRMLGPDARANFPASAPSEPLIAQPKAAACNVFLSVPADGVEQAALIKSALEKHEFNVSWARGLSVPEVADAVELADVVVVVGTRTYGNPMPRGTGTHEDLLFIVSESKRFYVVVLCERFDNATARYVLNSARVPGLSCLWADGHVVPPNLVQDIKNMRSGDAGVVSGQPPAAAAAVGDVGAAAAAAVPPQATINPEPTVVKPKPRSPSNPAPSPEPKRPKASWAPAPAPTPAKPRTAAAAAQPKTGTTIGELRMDEDTWYRGELQDGVPHGRGVLSIGDQQEITSDFMFGLPFGSALLRSSLGVDYVGQLENYKRHGLGTLIFPDGSCYDSQWENDRSVGVGVHYYANGDRFECVGISELKNGFGSYHHANGIKYTGYWKDDLQHGRGILEYPDGVEYQCEWVEGVMQGAGTIAWPSGERWQGPFVDGLRHGRGSLFMQEHFLKSVVCARGEELADDEQQPAALAIATDPSAAAHTGFMH